MSKYKVGQVLKLLGGLASGCRILEGMEGELFEVVAEDKDKKFHGWIKEWHKDEPYLCIKELKGDRRYCVNEDVQVEVIPFMIGEEVEIVDKSFYHAYEIGDIVKVIEIKKHGAYLEVKRDGDEFTQTMSFSNIGKIKTNVLTINDDNEVTYYEDGTEVKMKIKEDDLKAFLKKLKPTVPHLESLYDGVSIGVIGESTKLKDSLGAPLFVGDVVETYRNGNKLDSCFIVKEGCIGGAFVYGWAVSMSELAIEENYFNEEIKIRKIKSFEELENGYKLDDIKVVK